MPSSCNLYRQKDSGPDLSMSRSTSLSDSEDENDRENMTEATNKTDNTDESIRDTRRDLMRQVKVERKVKKKAENAEISRLGEERRKKEVKLNELSSISGFRKSGGGTHATKSQKKCYQCGEPGHEKRDCPGTTQSKVSEAWSRKSRCSIGSNLDEKLLDY